MIKFVNYIQVIDKEKKAGIVSMLLMDFLLDTRVPKMELEILKLLWQYNIVDEASALSLQQIADAFHKDKAYISRSTSLIEAHRIVHTFTKNRIKYFFISPDHYKTLSEPEIITSVKYDKANVEKQNVKAIKKISDKPEVKEIFDYYISTLGKDHRYTFTQSRASVIQARLNEGYTLQECKDRIDYIKQSPWHNGQNPEKKSYLDLKDVVFHKDKFDKWASQPKPKKQESQAEMQARIAEELRIEEIEWRKKNEQYA